MECGSPSWCSSLLSQGSSLCKLPSAAGFNEITSIVVLGSEASVDRLKKTESMAGFDGSLIMGRNSSIDNMQEDGMDAIPFSLADGALLDVSFKGRQAAARA